VPMVMDYLVGPLPVGPRTAIRPLKETYHRDDIPLNALGFADKEEILVFLAREVAPIAHVMEVSMYLPVSFIYPLMPPSIHRKSLALLPENETLVSGFIGPFSLDGSFRRLWMTWRCNAAGSYLQPIHLRLYRCSVGGIVWPILLNDPSRRTSFIDGIRATAALAGTVLICINLGPFFPYNY
jgi:primary-amine oxidase